MITVPVSPNHLALIDEDDFGLVGERKWYGLGIGHTHYATRQEKGKTIYMHRVILAGAKEVDHVNRNGLDNRRANLRSANRMQQSANRMNVPHSSRYKGVCWNKRLNKWEAHIQYDGRKHYLGLFTSEDEAGLAYNREATIHFGEFACLNEIGD